MLLPIAFLRSPRPRRLLWSSIMNLQTTKLLLQLGLFAGVVMHCGCGAEKEKQPTPATANWEGEAPAEPKVLEQSAEQEPRPPDRVAPESPSEKPARNRTKLGEGVWLEKDEENRRVIVDAQVCLRSGEYGLECLLCRRGTKEHESILQTSADAQVIHAALLAARAEAGHPVQFLPEFKIKSPTGSTIKILLRYKKDGKTVTVPAQQWVRQSRTKKNLEHDWASPVACLGKTHKRRTNRHLHREHGLAAISA